MLRNASPALRSAAALLLGFSLLGCGGDDSHASGDGPLVAPTELLAVMLPGPAVHLTWKDTPTEHHYSIERKDGAGEFKEISTVEFNMLSYHDADVTKGGVYSYRIAGASSKLDKSPYSSVVMITVQ